MLNPTLSQILVFIVVISALVFFVWWTYSFRKKYYGDPSKALRPFLFIESCSLILFFILFSILNDYFDPLLFFAFVFFSFVVYLVIFYSLTKLRRPPQSAVILFDLRKESGSSKLWLPAFLGITGSVLIVQFFVNLEFFKYILFFGWMSLFVFIILFYSDTDRFLLTQDGIYKDASIIKWTRIVNWIWGQPENQDPHLFIQLDGILSKINFKRIKIPENDKVVVNKIFSQYAPHVTVDKIQNLAIRPDAVRDDSEGLMDDKREDSASLG